MFRAFGLRPSPVCCRERSRGRRLDQNSQETVLGYRKSVVKHLKVRRPNSHNPSFPFCHTNFQYYKNLLWSPNEPNSPQLRFTLLFSLQRKKSFTLSLLSLLLEFRNKRPPQLGGHAHTTELAAAAAAAAAARQRPPERGEGGQGGADGCGGRR